MEPGMSARTKQIITTLAVLVVITVIAVGAQVSARKKSDPTTATVAPATATATSTAPAGYKDGTYSATGGFNTPGGPETIDISVTVKNGVVASTSATANSRDRESREYDTMFIDNYQQYVEGKNIANLNLSRIAGASLTPLGFNNALQQIKSDASA